MPKFQLTEDELREAHVLVFANKQDLPNAMTASELTDQLGLQSLRNRKVRITLLNRAFPNLNHFEKFRNNLFKLFLVTFYAFVVVHSGNLCNTRTWSL